MHFGNLDNYRIGDSIIRKAVWDLNLNCEKVKADDPVNNLVCGELTVPIKVKGNYELLWIESSITPHVYLLNELGYKTLSCCAGHKSPLLYNKKYISSGYIEVTHDAIKSIIKQFSCDEKSSIELHNVIDLSDIHMQSSIKIYEYNNCDGFFTGILEWNAILDKDNGKVANHLSKLFEYALYQLKQYVFRNIILELKRIA